MVIEFVSEEHPVDTQHSGTSFVWARSKSRKANIRTLSMQPWRLRSTYRSIVLSQYAHVVRL
jgi:hypothetical protein